MLHFVLQKRRLERMRARISLVEGICLALILLAPPDSANGKYLV